jgi:hypothetical protein
LVKQPSEDWARVLGGTAATDVLLHHADIIRRQGFGVGDFTIASGIASRIQPPAHRRSTRGGCGIATMADAAHGNPS